MLSFVTAIANRLKNDYSQYPDMWQKIQLIVIKIMSLGYTVRPRARRPLRSSAQFASDSR
ncbi:hypothetical protein [Symbiopectobacterium sp. RP]|uniref:hypothetical protein n=1 Tax=Symbiopectobacterium sp. RP TaxID=3248553 RepID=UPI003D26F8D1